VTEWEYRKIDLNQLPRKTDDIDVLCDAGDEGWELAAILANNVAYLKRQREAADAAPSARNKDSAPAAQDANSDGDGSGAIEQRAQAATVKYRNPETNETWSGRGRMSNWLKRKQDAGEDIDKYLV
jgi:DNA-binding protein H-NS